MGYELETGSVDLPGAFGILSLQLLKEGVVDPQIDVALPIPLLSGGRHIGDSTLIHLRNNTVIVSDRQQ